MVGWGSLVLCRRSLFSPCSQLTFARLIYFSHTHLLIHFLLHFFTSSLTRSRTHSLTLKAFVDFEDVDGAILAVERLQGFKLSQTHTLHLNYAK